MIKKFLVIVLPFTALIILTGSQMKINGIAGRTGSPGESTCITCHGDFSINSPGGSISISSPGTPGFQYTPTMTYTITVTVARSGFGLFGVGVEALNSANSNAGTFINTNASTHLLNAGNGRSNVVHTTNGGLSSGTMSFTFDWTAPTAGTGNVTFYFDGIAADQQNDEGGDWVYSSTQVFTEANCAAPSQPGSLAGNFYVCNGATTTYSISSVAGATSYTWVLPSGWTGTSTTTSINATSSNLSGDVKVFANNACGSSSPSILGVTVDNISAPITTVDINCNGGNNGSATVTPSGGLPQYTYLWTPTGNTNATISNLTGGTYSVTVTDANGCKKTTSTTLTPPTVVALTPSQSNNHCFGDSTGSATIVASGGTGPYSYSWTPGGGTTASISNLPKATYNVVVTDSKGCTKTSSVVLTQPPVISTTSTQNNINCNGAQTGSASIIATGGTGTLHYNWLPSGGTLSSASNLRAGTYTITVSDSFSCTKSTTLTLTEPQGISISDTSVLTTCGLSNGKASAHASGGTGTFTYSWNSSPIQNNDTAFNLASGNYIVTVTDSLGCSDTAHINVGTASTLSATWEKTDVICHGDSNGMAIVIPSGGTPGYTISWNTIPIQVNDTAINLKAGNYTTIITDNSGCTFSVSIPITEPTLLTANSGNNQSVCAGSGVIIGGSPSANGGTLPYRYSWSPTNNLDSSAISNPVANPLSTTTYSLVVTDSSGCTAQSKMSVKVNSLPQPFITMNNDTLISSPASSYQWLMNGNIISGANDSIFLPLQNGNYFVLVSDTNGCSDTSSVFNATSVSIDNQTPESSIHIFPNPASDKLYIQNHGNKELLLSLSDITGKTILQYLISKNETMISLDGVSNGFYLVTIENGKQKITSGLIISR